MLSRRGDDGADMIRIPEARRSTTEIERAGRARERARAKTQLLKHRLGVRLLGDHRRGDEREVTVMTAVTAVGEVHIDAAAHRMGLVHLRLSRIDLDVLRQVRLVKGPGKVRTHDGEDPLGHAVDLIDHDKRRGLLEVDTREAASGAR